MFSLVVNGQTLATGPARRRVIVGETVYPAAHAGWTETPDPEPVPPDPAVVIAERIAAAWAEADAYALTIADHNERARYLAYLIDPSSSAARLARLAEIQVALDSVWAEYGRVRAILAAGGEASFDSSNCDTRPWTIWEIAVS